MHSSQGVLIQMDHPVFGTAKVSGLQINNVVVAPGTLLIPLCSANNNDEDFYQCYKSLSNDLSSSQYFSDRDTNAFRPTNVSSHSMKFKLMSKLCNSFKHRPKLVQTNVKVSASNVPHTLIEPQIENITEKLTLCTIYQYNKFKTIVNEVTNWTLRTKESEKAFQALLSEILSTFIFFMVGNPCRSVFYNTLQSFFKIVQDVTISPGDPVIVESTPFGNTSFINSWSHGIISKCIGGESGGFLTDSMLVFGCEGSPVYKFDKGVKGSLIGIIVHTISWCNGEWVGFSLGLSVKHLLNEYLGSKLPERSSLPNLQCDNRLSSKINTDCLSASVLFVRCGNKWGSGVVIDSQAGIILTCSHVVQHNPDAIRVLWQNGELKASLVYATPLSEPYDLAVLSVGKVPGLRHLEFADTPPVLGEEVVTVGYPLSTEALVRLNKAPTLSAGCVSKVSGRGGPLKTTCCTQSGVSGGPLVRPPDRLLGIVVSNVRLGDTVLPSVGIAVSAQDVKAPLLQYLRTKEPSYLHQLTVDNLSLKMDWALRDSKL